MPEPAYGRIDAMPQEDLSVPRKQMHTTIRIHHRLACRDSATVVVCCCLVDDATRTRCSSPMNAVRDVLSIADSTGISTTSDWC
ncbi:hypothetical protein CKY47_34880 [Saccharothrix yanglingensis]|uniref:Uncharacterized protein n=1 Tax=Saccharothrix yanglingensis TaxID=659496 RepID=A0ABU0XAQ6_9PSEU|nr:hypothetical protein [Saccharothrix yanglingensis]